MTKLRLRSWMTSAIGAFAGLVIGFLLGVMVTLALVTALARFRQFYIEGVSDLDGPIGAPVLLGPLIGAVMGWRSSRDLAAATAGTFVGAAAGIGVGVFIAWAAGAPVADHWAGATVAGGIGALAGASLALLRQHRSAARAVVVVAVASIACAGPPPPIPVDIPAAPPMLAEDIEAVVFLAGDAGAARLESSPLLNALGSEVETWSGQLGRDSAIVVVMLGDIVYPDGVHDPGSPGHAEDSAYVASQVAVVQHPAARRFASRMYFVAGNHDWGLRKDRAGARRLRNLGELLDRMRARGDAVALLPEAGTGMPHVVEAGDLRIVLLDTAWWIFNADPSRKQDVLDGLELLLSDQMERPVMLAAHHPIASAGPHGLRALSWRDLGIGFLLSRNGTIQQDLESVVYRDLLAGMHRIFSSVPRPLLFAGGHDHSLQVMQHDSAGEPLYSVVSGSASKVSGVSRGPGLLFGRGAPGYMRVVVRRSGAIDLFVVAAPTRYLDCGGEDSPGHDRCMRDGRAAFTEVFSMRLLSASSPRAAD